MHLLLKNANTCYQSLHFIIFMLFLHLWHCPVWTSESQAVFETPFDSPLNEKSERVPFCYDEESSSIFATNAISCNDLEGVGSLNLTCTLMSDILLDGDTCISGSGNIEVSAYVSIECPIKGCSVIINVTGSFNMAPYATIIAGSIAIEASSINLEDNSSINTTALGGPPPAQTSGTPSTFDGAGGGHGGRGASCLKDNQTNWGGDVYAWSTLSDPWSYGSKGGSTSSEKQYGGDGGGRIMLKVDDTLYINGSVTAEGGEGGLRGGGGSGGSIKIYALKLKGKGIISAAGGRGWGGGGGGRISVKCYSVQNILISAHGGLSVGCPDNDGAAGTIFDQTLQSLKVSNDNFSTETETPLLDFPSRLLWSNVFVESKAQVLVPLLWTRVQVRGQIRLLDGGQITFGLSDFPVSEFELVAEELLISDSVIKVYGAFRMSVKMLLMWNSNLQIDGGGNADAGTSLLEARNLVVLRQNSVICSNAELEVYGQGLLSLSGHGDAIKGQRLFLSLFYKITVGPGSLLQAPLDDEKGSSLATQSRCENQSCPMELINPSDDCHLNNSMALTLQICRVEDLLINGSVIASILHIHRARTVVIDQGGMISASELGCKEGIGKGKVLSYGTGGGAGHGGKGGSGYFNGTLVEGGRKYGDADLPCELGSGSGGSGDLLKQAAGGGLIVIGSAKWPLSKLEIYGSLMTDGETQVGANRNTNGSLMGGVGGGSGGTVLLFLRSLIMGGNSSLSIAGGNGGPIGGGGGGGGRVHFDWSDIYTGDEYVQVATVNGTIDASGGAGRNGGYNGEPGTITGNACPKGLYGTFCSECPVGTYKDTIGADPSLCTQCELEFIQNRATFTFVRGGATQLPCPYKCLSDRYKMPKCYTPLEEIVYTVGGPWAFCLFISVILVLLAGLMSILRTKLDGNEFTASAVQNHVSSSFPHLLSLSEVPGTRIAEETQNHVHRMYFMGPNTFREPWHLPYSPPDAISGIVYESAFNRFIEEMNSLAAYEWWEGSVFSILSVFAYPCAWSWKQWRRRKKIDRLQEYVKSEYDHICLRSCRSRALYKGMKVGSTPDLVIGYIDFFLGGDEKRPVISSILSQRFPFCVIFGGDGSFMSPYNLHSDILLTNLIIQYVPANIWSRFIDGLNAQLRTVRCGRIRSDLGPVNTWIGSHGNSQLEYSGVKVEMGWFQATTSGYYQLGLLIGVNSHVIESMQQRNMVDSTGLGKLRKNAAVAKKDIDRSLQTESCVANSSHERITRGVNGGIINEITLQSLNDRRDLFFPFSILLQNVRPIGFEGTLQLLMALMLLVDLTVTCLTLFLFYWISLGAFLVVLLVFPLSLISPIPSGLNAYFSRGPRSASLARIYALWNITSISNILLEYICGMSYCVLGFTMATNNWNDNEWWILPTILLVTKTLQAEFINWRIANLEVEDISLFREDPQGFWVA